MTRPPPDRSPPGWPGSDRPAPDRSPPDRSGSGRPLPHPVQLSPRPVRLQPAEPQPDRPAPVRASRPATSEGPAARRTDAGTTSLDPRAIPDAGPRTDQRAAPGMGVRVAPDTGTPAIAPAGLPRRAAARGLATAAAAALLAGCSQVEQNPQVRSLLGSTEWLTRWAQRLLGGRQAMAPTYTAAEISPSFRANGTIDPDDDDYQDMVSDKFASFALEIGGLVRTPLRLDLQALRAMPSQTQITRHDCVEGWSCIGQWTGVRLAALLDRAGLKPEARFIVFRCADLMTPGNPDSRYYESIDLDDAYHPQTILAYDMNGQPLPVEHGAPLRLRVERQLGYKMAKYVLRIEAVDSYAHIGAGKGGYWEDLGYTWYAGI